MAGRGRATRRGNQVRPALATGVVLDVAKTVTEIRVGLAGVALFEADRADVRPRAADLLSQAASIVRERAGAEVLIEGHGDGRGGEVYSRRLGERRANAVAQWLVVREGLRDVRMIIRGVGEAVHSAAGRVDLRATPGLPQRGRVDIVLSRADESAARRAGGRTGDAGSQQGG